MFANPDIFLDYKEKADVEAAGSRPKLRPTFVPPAYNPGWSHIPSTRSREQYLLKHKRGKKIPYDRYILWSFKEIYGRRHYPPGEWHARQEAEMLEREREVELERRAILRAKRRYLRDMRKIQAIREGLRDYYSLHPVLRPFKFVYKMAIHGFQCLVIRPIFKLANAITKPIYNDIYKPLKYKVCLPIYYKGYLPLYYKTKYLLWRYTPIIGIYRRIRKFIYKDILDQFIYQPYNFIKSNIQQHIIKPLYTLSKLPSYAFYYPQQFVLLMMDFFIAKIWLKIDRLFDFPFMLVDQIQYFTTFLPLAYLEEHMEDIVDAHQEFKEWWWDQLDEYEIDSLLVDIEHLYYSVMFFYYTMIEKKDICLDMMNDGIDYLNNLYIDYKRDTLEYINKNILKSYYVKKTKYYYNKYIKRSTIFNNIKNNKIIKLLYNMIIIYPYKFIKNITTIFSTIMTKLFITTPFYTIKNLLLYTKLLLKNVLIILPLTIYNKIILKCIEDPLFIPIQFLNVLIKLRDIFYFIKEDLGSHIDSFIFNRGIYEGWFSNIAYYTTKHLYTAYRYIFDYGKHNYTVFDYYPDRHMKWLVRRE